MAELDKDILLKTRLFGFDKKRTIDYIEQILQENEQLKRQIEELNKKLDAKVEPIPAVEPVSNSVVTKIDGKTYITKK